MRNSLVLVLLCIGLTSGFIVPTSTTSEVNKTVPRVPSESKVSNTTDETERNKPINSDLIHIYNINEDDVKKELYNQGSEDNKNINERSFVVVNQRWKKIPYESHIVDTKESSLDFYINVAKTSSIINTVHDTENNPTNALTIKQQNEKENVKNTNKNYFPPTHHIHNSPFPNRDSYIDHRVKHKDSSKHRDFLEFMKGSVLRSERKNAKYTQTNRNRSPENIKSNNNLSIYNYTKHTYKKYLQDLNKATNDVTATFNNKGNVNGETRKNDLLFKDKIYDLQDNYNEDSLWAHKLYQLTLEEQALQKQSLQNRNNTDLKHFKYCQQCTGKTKLGKLNKHMDKECKCKCGRYIHLKGPSELKEQMDKRWEAFIKMTQNTK